MANPYRELFKAPGSRAFVVAGMIARMPMSMTGIGLITMLAQLKGGYALAGAVAATFALATAFCAPQVSRMVDRFGQGRVLPIAAGLGAGRCWRCCCAPGCRRRTGRCSCSPPWPAACRAYRP